MNVSLNAVLEAMVAGASDQKERLEVISAVLSSLLVANVKQELSSDLWSEVDVDSLSVKVLEGVTRCLSGDPLKAFNGSGYALGKSLLRALDEGVLSHVREQLSTNGYASALTMQKHCCTIFDWFVDDGDEPSEEACHGSNCD